MTSTKYESKKYMENILPFMRYAYNCSLSHFNNFSAYKTRVSFYPLLYNSSMVKVLKLFCILVGRNADLIGFNRLGNLIIASQCQNCENPDYGIQVLLKMVEGRKFDRNQLYGYLNGLAGKNQPAGKQNMRQRIYNRNMKRRLGSQNW